MSLRLSCPHCATRVQLEDRFAGNAVRCGQCGRAFTAPGAAAADPAPIMAAELVDEGAIHEPMPPVASSEAPRRFRSRLLESDGPRSAEPVHQAGGQGLTIALLAGAGFVVLAAGIVIAVMLSSDSGAERPAVGEARAWDRHRAVVDMEIREERARAKAVWELERAKEAVEKPAFPEPDFPIGVPPIKDRPFDKLKEEFDIPKPKVVEPEEPLVKAEPLPAPDGTLTKVRPVSEMDAPGKVVQIVHAPAHGLIFLRNPDGGIWVMDAREKKLLGLQPAKTRFTDMTLSPDASVLFAADFGEENAYSDPVRPHWIHRYDLNRREWSSRRAPKIAWSIKALDAQKFLLLESDQWVDLTLNRWEDDGASVRELSRINAGYSGNISADPVSRRIYHGNWGLSSREIVVRRASFDKLIAVDATGSYGTAHKAGGGGTIVLSPDGRRLYYGPLQVDAFDVKTNLRSFPEWIHAASRDLAFGEKGYYDAGSGARLGDLGFSTTVYALADRGQVLWAYDPGRNVLRQYSIEGK